MGVGDWLAWWKRTGDPRTSCSTSSKPVLVDIKDDVLMQGELLEWHRYGIIIKKAKVASAEGKFVPLPEPGEVFIPMHRILTIQFLPEGVILNEA